MSDPNAILHQALARHQSGDLPVACDLYLQVLAAIPTNPDALHLLGVARAALGDPFQAISLIRQAIAERPCFPPPHLNLGTILLGDGHQLDALAAFTAALDTNPENIDSRTGRANALRALNRLDEAVRDLDHVLFLRSDHVPA